MNVIKYPVASSICFTNVIKAIFPGNTGSGYASLTCHMNQFEQSYWIMSANFISMVGEGVACGGLPFSGTGCPIPDVDKLCLLCIDLCLGCCFYFNHLSRMFLSTGFAFRITDRTSCHGPHIYMLY